jgi:hypothetical protein
MEPSHQLGMLRGDCLIVVVDYEAVILRFHRVPVHEELVESGNELFERLIADAPLSAGWIEVSFVYALCKQPSPIPAPDQCCDLEDGLTSFGKRQMDVRLGLLIILFEFGIPSSVAEGPHTIYLRCPESRNFGSPLIVG